MPMDFTPLANLLKQADNFALITHEKPDGDAVGSCQAMAALIEQQGKKATVCLVGPCPAPYRFLLAGKDSLDILHQPFPTGTEAILILDTGTWNQLGAGKTWLQHQTIPRLVLDHHRTQDDLGGPALVDTSAEATGTLVHQAYQYFGLQPSRPAALALFTAIAFDTGWFRHSNVGPGTFQVAGELVSLGADPTFIYRQVHQQEPIRRMLLKGRALSSLKLFQGGKVCSLHLSHQDFLDTGCTLSDSEGLSDLPRQIAGVEVAIALFEEAPGKVRASLRSSGAIDVGKVAESFAGGGHKAAAGCRLEMDLNSAESALLDSISVQIGD